MSPSFLVLAILPNRKPSTPPNNPSPCLPAKPPLRPKGRFYKPTNKTINKAVPKALAGGLTGQ